jgi:hypothetical protein
LVKALKAEGEEGSPLLDLVKEFSADEDEWMLDHVLVDGYSDMFGTRVIWVYGSPIAAMVKRNTPPMIFLLGHQLEDSFNTPAEAANVIRERLLRWRES